MMYLCHYNNMAVQMVRKERHPYPTRVPCASILGPAWTQASMLGPAWRGTVQFGSQPRGSQEPGNPQGPMLGPALTHVSAWGTGQWETQVGQKGTWEASGQREHIACCPTLGLVWHPIKQISCERTRPSTADLFQFGDMFLPIKGIADALLKHSSLKRAPSVQVCTPYFVSLQDHSDVMVIANC